MHLSTSKKIVSSVVTTTTVLWSMGLASLAPLAASAAVSLNAGDLIRGNATPAVYYYGGDGKRYVFPNEKTYKTWYSDFSTVKRISDADLAAISLASSNVTYKPATKLVKVTTDPKVYAVDKNGTFRWVKTEAVAVALWGAGWASQVEDLPDAFWSNYSVGADISAAADFNLTAVQAASATIAADKGIAGGVVTGAVTAALASDSPAASSVANNAADVVFAKVTFTGTGTITSLKVKRTGLSSDARLTGVKLFDGTTQLATSQTLNSTHKATFNGLNVAVAGSKTLTLAGDVVAAGGAGEIIKLGIESAADVTLSGGTSPAGTYPIEGAGMTIVSVSIGAATLSNGPQHPSSDTNVDSDAKDFRFTQVRVTAGSNEDIMVKQIVAVRSGTAADTDVKDMKLVNDTTGATLGTVAALSSSRAVFDNLNVMVKKGEFVDLSIKASVTGAGSSRTLGFELHDGTTYLVRVVGSTYGFGITPTRSNFCATAGVTGGACTTQTIKLGTLDVARSSQSPAASNVALGGTGIALGAFDFTVTGEPVRVSSMKLRLTPATASASEVTNIAFYDASSGSIAGPKDGSTTTVSTAEDLTFTDSITFPVGKTTLWVKANLSTSMSAGDTLLVTLLDPSTNMTVRGDQSGKSITARTTSNVTANTQTIQGPSLKVVTAGIPSAGTIVKGVQDFTFAVIDLDPAGSGEDIKVTEMVVTDTIGASAALTDVNNLELWGDPDNTDATDTVERLQTSNSTSVNAATVTFSFSSPIRVSKTRTSRVYLKADVLSTTTNTGTTAAFAHTFNVASAASSVISTGWTTGSTITETFSGAGQAQKIGSTGALKVEMSASRPNQAQLVAGSTGNTFVQYKLTSSNESINIRRIPIAVMRATTETGAQSAVNAGTTSSLAKVFAYVSDSGSGTQTLIGDTSGYTIDSSGVALINMDSAPLTLTKDKEKFLTFKVNFNPKADVASGSIIVVGIGDSDSDGSTWGTNGAAAAGSYNIVAVGVDSGSTITATDIDSVGDGSGNVQASFNMPVYDGVLTITKKANSPSNPSGTTADLLYFDLTGSGDEITINDLEFVYSPACTVTGTGAVTLVDYNSSSTVYATWTAGTAWMGLGSGSRSFKIGATGDASNGTTRSAGGITTGRTLKASGETQSLKLIGDVSGCTPAAGSTLNISINVGEGTHTGAADTTALTSGVEWADVELAAASSEVDSLLTKNLPIKQGFTY